MRVIGACILAAITMIAATARFAYTQDSPEIAAAKEINAKWRETFDKTGNFPAAPAIHRRNFEIIDEMSKRDPSNAELKSLADEMRARSSKILGKTDCCSTKGPRAFVRPKDDRVEMGNCGYVLWTLRWLVHGQE